MEGIDLDEYMQETKAVESTETGPLVYKIVNAERADFRTAQSMVGRKLYPLERKFLDVPGMNARVNTEGVLESFTLDPTAM